MTANGRDFLKLYAAEEVYAGLVIIVHGNGTAERQVELFGLALDRLETLSDLTNTLIEGFEGGALAVRSYPAPSA